MRSQMKRFISLLLAAAFAAGMIASSAGVLAAGEVYGICQICQGSAKCGLCDPAEGDDRLGDGHLVCIYCHQTGYITCGTNTAGDGTPIGCDGSGYRKDGSVCEVCGGKGKYPCDVCFGSGVFDCKCRQMGIPGVCTLCLGSGWRLVDSMGTPIEVGSPVYPYDGATIDFGVWGRHEIYTYNASTFGSGVTPYQAMANVGASTKDDFQRAFRGEFYPGGGGADDTPQGGEEPAPGPDVPQDDTRRYSVDLGSGVWDVAGRRVLSWVDGHTESGVIEADDDTEISFEDFDGELMKVRAVGENNFSVEFTVTDGVASLSRFEPAECVLPESFSIVVEATRPEKTDALFDRNGDVDLPSVPAGDAGPAATARIIVGKMTPDEKKYYDSLDEEELGRLINDISAAVGSFSHGKTVKQVENAARQNGIGSFREGRIYVIALDGRFEIGFPIEITAKIEKGALDGGRDLYVYRVLADGTVESLGKAEYCTYDDGSVEEIKFFTTGLSSFFTSSEQIDTSLNYNAGTDTAKYEKTEDEKDGSGLLIPAVIITAVLAAAAGTAFLVLRKRKGAAKGENCADSEPKMTLSKKQ